LLKGAEAGFDGVSSKKEVARSEVLGCLPQVSGSGDCAGGTATGAAMLGDCPAQSLVSGAEGLRRKKRNCVVQIGGGDDLDFAFRENNFAHVQRPNNRVVQVDWLC